MGKSGEIWRRCYPAFCTHLLAMLSAAVLLSRIKHGWRGQTLAATSYRSTRVYGNENSKAPHVISYSAGFTRSEDGAAVVAKHFGLRSTKKSRGRPKRSIPTPFISQSRGFAQIGQRLRTNDSRGNATGRRINIGHFKDPGTKLFQLVNNVPQFLSNFS